MKTKAKVAIIGLGTIGGVLATNLSKGNRNIILADRNLGKAKNLSQKLGTLTQPMEIPAAIKEADIVILAVWFDAIKELLHQYATDLQGKIIIDPSNPIAPDGKGGFSKKIGEKESAAGILANMLPKEAKLVKALGTLGAASLEKAAFQSTERAVLFYATNEKSIHPQVEELIRDTGFEPLFIGGMEQSIRIEVFGDLHEFGALGKTVTLAQAGQKAYVKQPLNT